jgi:V8-like Glu-specific endopeptidase
MKLLEREDGRHVPAIVTNKHVVRDAKNGRFIFTLSDNNGDPSSQLLKYELNNFEQQWIMHPENNVDLCILPIGQFLQDFSSKGQAIFYIPIGTDIIPKKEVLDRLSAIEDIVMVGYPNGLWDSVNNLPILRKGITATHPNKDYNGAKEFMIDAACYPGSSGSPVFIYNEGTYSDGPGNIRLSSRILMVGVLYAGPQFTATGDIHVVNIPTSNKPIVLSRIPNNLGLIIKSEKLLDFEGILNKLIRN